MANDRSFYEQVVEALNTLSGEAWKDGADYEHDHKALTTGLLRWDFQGTGQLQYFDGTDWQNIHPVLPTEADGEKLWIEEPA